jgi:hypothetical protein
MEHKIKILVIGVMIAAITFGIPRKPKIFKPIVWGK